MQKKKAARKPLGVCKVTKSGSEEPQGDHMPAQMRENARRAFT